METLEDKYLMKKVQEGDFSKLGLLYERYNRELFGYFFRLTSDGARSEDLVQNVFYRLLKYRESYRGEGKFVYWMYSVARNAWMDLYRKKDPMHRAGELNMIENIPHYDKDAHSQMETTERAEALRAALLHLTPEKREAIVMSRFQGLKYKEIARLCNCSENAIKSRVQRGLMELKCIIEKSEAI